MHFFTERILLYYISHSTEVYNYKTELIKLFNTMIKRKILKIKIEDEKEEIENY